MVEVISGEAEVYITRSTAMEVQEDLIWEYVCAMDCGNMDRVNTVLEQAQKDQGPWMAIDALHRKFDSNELFTVQLLQVRGEFLKQERR